METLTSHRRQQTAVPAGPGAARLLSLDIFRGITVAGMILVNNPGDWGHVYPPLQHAAWHGWTPTDLIFPFFLFIVGTAMPYSFSRRIERGASRPRLFLHVLYRSALLFALGMVLSGLPDFDFTRKLILDVLQRIGVVYLLSGTIVLLLGLTGQAIVGVLCLVLYWVLMMVIPVPGYGAGVLAPDGNAWQYIDTLLTAGWHEHGEGILSLIPSVSTVLLGSLTGSWLRSGRPPQVTALGMFGAGSIGLAIGLILDVWFPINKLLWSPAYVVFTAGFALIVLAFCYWLADIKGWKGWGAPFVLFGMNAITAFFLSSLFSRLMGLAGLRGSLYRALFPWWLSPFNASLAWACCYLLLWLGVMWILYRKRIFLKI